MTNYSEYQVENPRISPEHYAKYYIPVSKKGRKLYKSKHKLIRCPKCDMKYAEENFTPLCYICGLKNKGFYRSAIKEMTNPHTGEIGCWWGFRTKWDFKPGWSFAPQLWWTLIVTNILNHPGLNESCKAPDFTEGFRKDGWPAQLSTEKSLLLMGESDWRIKTSLAFYSGFVSVKKKHILI